MNEREEEALAELLRAALREEAERHVPAGDGLSLIRDRVQARRRFSWARPVLVMGAVAAVAAAATVLPAALRHGGHSHLDNTAAGNAPATASPLSPTASQHALSAENVPTQSPYTTLPSGVRDMRTVWPYTSRAQGYYHAKQDISSGQHPELTDAGQTALTFVHQYVGEGVKLITGPSMPSDSGVDVVVNRVLEDGTWHAVTQVRLVSVSDGQQAPYVVQSAVRPSDAGTQAKDPAASNSLTAATADELTTGADRITVTGQVGRSGTVSAAGEAPLVKVELCDAGGRSLAFTQASGKPRTGDPVTYYWQAQLNFNQDQVSDAASIAAWTLDENADVLEFVALPAPVRLATVPASDAPAGTDSPGLTSAPGAATPTPGSAVTATPTS